MTPGDQDIIVVGLVGNHFHLAKNMDDLPWYAKDMMVNVVNKFPGRVVVLGASPQHFAGDDGSYLGKGVTEECGPPVYRFSSEGSVDNTTGAVELCNMMWVYNVKKYLAKDRAEFIDVYRLLSPLWMCHRMATDCTHWNDAVYSLLATTVLQALEDLG